MVSLFNSLPAGMLWALALLPVVGIVVVLWKDPLSASVRGRRKLSTSGPLVGILWGMWKGLAALSYFFLLGFPLLFLLLGALPTIRVLRENDLTAADLVLYGQRREAVALVVPPADRNLFLSSEEQVQADDDKLRRVFPNENDWGKVLSWGRYLARDQYQVALEGLTIEQADRQAAHIAWRHLTRIPGTKESDLLNLEAAIARAVPEEAERRGLFEWARARNHYVEAWADALLFTPLPKLDWFAWWTVYTEYCPTDDLLAGRKKFLVERLGGDRFGRDLWAALLDWGEECYDRQPALVRLLPRGERAYQVAAVDRMVGLDEPGRKVYVLDNANQVPRGKDYTVLCLATHVFYPNDDLTYLQFGNGWGGEHSLFATGKDAASLALVVLGLYLVFWALFVQRVMRRLTLYYLGWGLGVEDNPSFRRLEQAAFHPWLQVVSLLVVLPIGWLFARLFMDGFYVLYFRSDINLVLAVVYSVLIGGALCEAIQNILAVLCIRLGLAPERMVVDNLVAGALGAAVLWFFQNSWYSIASGLALGLFTSVVVKLFWARGRAVPARG